MLANKKCPQIGESKRKVTTIDVFKGSTILIPAGTKIEVFINEDPKNPESDVYPLEVIIQNDHYVLCTEEMFCLEAE